MPGLRNLNRSYTEGRICGTPYVGMLGSEVPTTGIDGPAYFLDHPSFPADLTQRVAARITTPPTAGTLYAYEDGSFTFLGPDGVYSVGYQFYLNGVAAGAETFFSITQGTGVRAGSGVSAVGLALSAATTKNGIGSGIGVIGLAMSAASTTGKASSTDLAMLLGLSSSAVALKATTADSIARCGTAADSLGLAATNDAKAGAAQSRFGQAATSTGAKAAIGTGVMASGLASSAIGAKGARGVGASASGAVAVSIGAAGSGAGASAAQIWAYEVVPGVTAAQALAAVYANIGNDPTAAEIVAALVAAVEVAPLKVNVKQMNNANVIGDGSVAEPWRGEGVPAP